MPTMENIIFIGNSRVTGLRPTAPPAVNIRAIMPSMATIMTTGIIFIRMLPGMTRGTSGGGSRCTSPPGGRGADRRGERLNCSVLTVRAPLRQQIYVVCGTASAADPGAAILRAPTDRDAPFGEEQSGLVGRRTNQLEGGRRWLPVRRCSAG